MEHSSHGPSTWGRWLRCAGAPNAEEGLPDENNWEAAQGTVFHEMAATCLELGLEPDGFLGSKWDEKGHVIEIDEEMVFSFRPGADYIRRLAADPDVLLFVEVRVDISPWTFDNQFGTADVLLVNPVKRWVIVFDWKYGMEPVYPQENEQGLGYVLGAWNTLLWQLFGDSSGVTVEVVIEQPRVLGAGGSWKTTMDWVLEFGESVSQRAALTTDPDARRTAGEKQCRWCKARRVCETRSAWYLETMRVSFDDLDFSPAQIELPKNITPERRSRLLELGPQIRLWLEDLHKSAYSDAEHGRPVPGFKMVDGKRPRRAWYGNQKHKAERVMVDALGEDGAYEDRKMLSPAQAQKKVGKDRYEELFAAFVDVGKPHPILVSEKDRRPKKPTIEEMFD